MTMPGLGPIGQISRNVADIPRSVEWYKTILGLPHLFTFGDLAFFDCGGTRLYLQGHRPETKATGDSVIYFTTPDINISLNNRSLSKNKPIRETGTVTDRRDRRHNDKSRGHSCQGAKKIDKKPASSKRTSH